MNKGKDGDEKWRSIGKIRNHVDLEVFRGRYGQLTVFPVYSQCIMRDSAIERIFVKNSSSIEKSLTKPLEQLLHMAKTMEGEEILELIVLAIEDPGVHCFGELLEMPHIKELENGPYHVHWNTLNLFAYGTYKQYLADKDKYLDLTPVQKNKLQHLTIITLAEKTRYIPYSLLLEELCVTKVRDLEDLIIEAVYAAIIQGKLDQINSLFEVDRVVFGRDVTPDDIEAVAKTLTTLGNSCQTILTCIEKQILRANAEKQKTVERKNQMWVDVELARRK